MQITVRSEIWPLAAAFKISRGTRSSEATFSTAPILAASLGMP